MCDRLRPVRWRPCGALLLSCPAASGLFHRAILQSGGCERFAFDRSKPNEKTYSASEALIAHVGGGGPEEQRRLPTEVIKQASHLFSGVIPKPGRVHTPANLAWMPVNDGAILPVDSDSRSLGSVPLLLGFTRNEARYFIRPGMLPYNRIILRAMTKVLASAQAKAVLAQLAAQGSSTYDRCDQVYTAAIWAEPMLATANAFWPQDINFIAIALTEYRLALRHRTSWLSIPPSFAISLAL